MSVKAHEAFSIDSFQDRLLWWDDFLGDQLQDEWNAAGTGSAVVVDQQTGGIVRLTTGATNNDTQIIDWNDIRSLHIDQKVTMETRVKLEQLANMGCWIYLYGDGNNRVQFVSFGGLNWEIECRNGGVSTVDGTGVAPDTDFHIFRIECFPTDEVHFYIDGVETANSPITTNIPDDAGDFLQPRLFVLTGENVAHYIDIDYVVVRQEI